MSSSDVKSKLGKEDFNAWGGNATKTFARRTSDGGTVTLHKIGNIVDVLQVYGDGSTPAHSNLTDAIVGAEGQECCFELAPGTWPVTADLTIPSTVTVCLRRGAAFSVSSGKTLTLSGPVIAEESTWYSGAGTVVYTAGGGFFPLVDDLLSTSAGKGSDLVGVTGQAGKNLGDLFDGGKDVPVGCSTIDVSGAATLDSTLNVAGAAALAGTLDVVGTSTVVAISASGTLGGNLKTQGASVNNISNTSITTSTPTIIQFPSENFDTDSFHDPSTNNQRITIPSGLESGKKMMLVARVVFDLNATGIRWAGIYKNNTIYVATGQVNASAGSYQPYHEINIVTPVLTPVANDWFDVRVWQNSGVTLDVLGSRTEFSVIIF